MNPLTCVVVLIGRCHSFSGEEGDKMLYDFTFSASPHYYIHARDIENFFSL